MSTMHARIAALACAVVLDSGAPIAQQTQRTLPPERGADLLSVDFAAVSADGRPIPDLQPSDVSLRIGGRRRTIRSLQLISVRASDDAPAGPALPAPFGTNAENERGRALVLIIDDDSFKAGREAPLREAVDQLVGRLSARDQLSLVTMPYGGVKVPLTTDHERVRAAVLRIVGQSTGVETGSELACRTRRTLETLSAYLDTQLGIRETPVNIMFITGGLAGPRRDAPVSMAPGMCELRSELFREVAEAAGAARAHFYVIQPGDMMLKPGSISRENIAGANFIGSDNPMEGIEHLTGSTGGKQLYLTGSADGALGRVFTESGAYYLATIEPDRSDRSGRTQQLEIRVSRPGVELRARPHVTFAEPDRLSRRVTNPSPRDMLSVTSVFRDLPLRATAYTALDADGKSMRIVTMAETADGVQLGTLVAALFDREGKSVSHWTATAEELQRSPVIGAMPVEPGAYRLRVAAIDTTGRAGTADYEVDTEMAQTGSLRLSSIILGLSREGRFTPRLQFGSEPTAMAYIEMYGAPPGARIASILELSTTMNGPAMASLPLALEAAGPNRYIATGVVPIGTLSPGDYVVRAMVGLEGQPMTRVTRTLRKIGTSADRDRPLDRFDRPIDRSAIGRW
jgi:VWFA-related protein